MMKKGILTQGVLTLCLTLAVTLVAGAAAQAEGWRDLFNGENLDGWRTIGDPEWRVEDGVIKTEGTGEEMGFLIHEDTFSDFVLRLRFKWHGGNSGIGFRSFVDPENHVVGYQANIDYGRPRGTGSLIEEYGRGTLRETTIPAEELQVEGWNTMEINALGDRIYIFVNGKQTGWRPDRSGRKSGIIALQMDVGEDAAMEFTDIRILEVPDNSRLEWLYRGGDSIEGWQPLGDSIWTVLKDSIVGVSGNGGYGWLVSEEAYKDFHFSTRFWMPRGNSGIQFRSWVVDEMLHGYQADLASETDWISGHLYDQNERGSLAKPEIDFTEVINWNGWNTYEITAIGPTVQLFINGVKSIEYEDPERDQAGKLAFQIHSGMEMVTFWRDVRMISFDAAE